MHSNNVLAINPFQKIAAKDKPEPEIIHSTLTVSPHEMKVTQTKLFGVTATHCLFAIGGLIAGIYIGYHLAK